MKTLIFLFASIAPLAALSQGRVGQMPIPANNSYTVTAMGPHHRTWQRVALETNLTGKVSARTNVFTELQTGLAYLNPNTGRWQEGQEKFEIAADGSAFVR